MNPLYEFERGLQKPMQGDWPEQAKCRGMSIELMVSDEAVDIIRAKRICSGCPVTDKCLEYALSEPRERFGVWGGTSERDRRRMIKEQRKAS